MRVQERLLKKEKGILVGVQLDEHSAGMMTGEDSIKLLRDSGDKMMP